MLKLLKREIWIAILDLLDETARWKVLQVSSICYMFRLKKPTSGKYMLTIIYKLLNCVIIWIHTLQYSIY
jgi:hypothetical protein